jgi:hypothetical protein
MEAAMTRGLVVLAVLATLSCNDSSGPSTLGSLSFTFTGGGGGTFSASGVAPSFSSAPSTGSSWAAGYVEAGETIVAGSRPRSGGLIDLVLLRLTRTTAGSETIDANCNIDGSVPCNGMILYLNFNGTGDTGDFFCGLISGTIVVTSVSDGRAQGTFSGTGECSAGVGGAISAFTVSNGTFDVALVAPPS